ncbi:MAG: FmdB family zinc ribbon protein [Candidatus Adiutrix sp.]
MPIYEYQCAQCGETTEVLQKFSDAPLTTCPNCQGQMSKLMSMNSFQLKGGGWYVTDYNGKNKPETKTSAPCEAAAACPAACPKKEAAAPTSPAKKAAKAKAAA